MPEKIEYPVSFEKLLVMVSGVEKNNPLIVNYLREREEKNSMISHYRREYYEPKEIDEYRIEGHPTSNLVRFLVDFGSSWRFLDKNIRDKTVGNLKRLYNYIRNPFSESVSLTREHIIRIEERMGSFALTDELAYTVGLFTTQTGETVIPRVRELDDQVNVKDDSVFNDMEKYKKGFWKSNNENDVKYEEKVIENKEIIKAFEQTNSGFKVVEKRVDGIALMMTTEITETREQIKNMQKELKESELKIERAKAAWQRMETDLGRKVEEYDDKADELLERYETFIERMERRDRARNISKEWWFLERLEVARQWQESSRRNDERRREIEKRDEERHREFKDMMKWWDHYFNADFKNMGYIYVPAWCLYRPQGIVKEEYSRFVRGENVRYGRLIKSLSALTLYSVVSLVAGIKLIMLSWNRFLHDFLKNVINREIDMWNTIKEDNNSGDWKKNKILKILVGLWLTLFTLLGGYGYFINRRNMEKTFESDKVEVGRNSEEPE